MPLTSWVPGTIPAICFPQPCLAQAPSCLLLSGPFLSLAGPTVQMTPVGPGHTHMPGPGTSPPCPTPQEVPPASLPPISTLCSPQGGLWLLWGFWPAQCPAGSGFWDASPLPPAPDCRGQAQAPHPDPVRRQPYPSPAEPAWATISGLLVLPSPILSVFLVRGGSWA